MTLTAPGLLALIGIVYIGRTVLPLMLRWGGVIK